MHKIEIEGDDMYEKLAWKHFEKTGSIESFLEYKKIVEENEKLATYNAQNLTQNIRQNVGELLNEIDQGKRDRN